MSYDKLPIVLKFSFVENFSNFLFAFGYSLNVSRNHNFIKNQNSLP